DRPEGKATLLMLTRLPYQAVCFDLVPKKLAQGREAARALSVNENVFRKHLRQDQFQLGVDRGLWRLVRIDWPTAVVAGSAARHPIEWLCRFHLAGYPANPPGIEFWDEKNRVAIPAGRWPSWFKQFIAQSYPQLLAVEPAPYSRHLLQLSLFIARRKRQ